MDSQQQQRTSRVAQEFTEALVEAYKTTSDSTVVAQQLGARQVEYFFDAVTNNLRIQAEGAVHVTQQLATQQHLARKVTQEFLQVSADNYMDLLDSLFSFYHGGMSRTQKRIEEAEARVEEARRRAEEAESNSSEAERQTEEARSIARAAQARVKEAEKGARAAQRRAREAERSLEETREQVEGAERRAEEARVRSREMERSLREAQRRTLDFERRAQVAEGDTIESESAGGDEEGDAKVDAIRHPLNKWVRTSGSSKVRGWRNTRSPGRSSRRR